MTGFSVDTAKQKLKKVSNAVNSLMLENNCSIGVELKNGQSRIVVIDNDTNLMARFTIVMERVKVDDREKAGSGC